MKIFLILDFECNAECISFIIICFKLWLYVCLLYTLISGRKNRSKFSGKEHSNRKCIAVSSRLIKRKRKLPKITEYCYSIHYYKYNE